MEFVEVMKQWRRMCNKHTCSRNKDAFTGLLLCPIASLHDGYPCDEDPIDWTEKATKQLEEIVTDWAAENPEPVYPTWWTWLINEGVIEKGSTYTGAFDQLKMKSIPSDIAEKLGIEPKEG